MNSPSPQKNSTRRGGRQRRLELQFLESVRKRLPTHGGVVEALGHLYTSLGRIEEGLSLDRQMVQLEPTEPLAWYNLACSLALTGQTTEALNALETSVSLGYRDVEWMLQDADLENLKTHPHFIRLTTQLRS